MTVVYPGPVIQYWWRQSCPFVHHEGVL